MVVIRVTLLSGRCCELSCLEHEPIQQVLRKAEDLGFSKTGACYHRNQRTNITRIYKAWFLESCTASDCFEHLQDWEAFFFPPGGAGAEFAGLGCQGPAAEVSPALARRGLPRPRGRGANSSAGWDQQEKGRELVGKPVKKCENHGSSLQDC